MVASGANSKSLRLRDYANTPFFFAVQVAM